MLRNFSRIIVFMRIVRKSWEAFIAVQTESTDYEASRSRKKSIWITAEERKFLTKANTGADKKQTLMFIGDRGTGVGSRIKGFRKYGGRWKEQLRGKHVTVCITNEHMTSQTCIYCYQELCHPKAILTKKNKQVLQENRSALMCMNPKCVAVKSGKSTKSRDALSSLAIGLSGLTQCLIGSPLPPFAQSQISQFNTDIFNKLSWSFVPVRDHLTSMVCSYDSKIHF